MVQQCGKKRLDNMCHEKEVLSSCMHQKNSLDLSGIDVHMCSWYPLFNSPPQLVNQWGGGVACRTNVHDGESDGGYIGGQVYVDIPGGGFGSMNSSTMSRYLVARARTVLL